MEQQHTRISYSQWIKWCQVLCLILPFLITLSKTCWHSLAWLRTNSAIQPDFRLHSDQTRSLCSSNSPEKNVHLKVQYQKTYFQQHSLSTFFQRRKSWRQGSGVAWSHNCWTGDNCINSKAVTNCFQRVFMFIVKEYSTFNATEEKQDFLHQLSDFFKVRT